MLVQHQREVASLVATPGSSVDEHGNPVGVISMPGVRCTATPHDAMDLSCVGEPASDKRKQIQVSLTRALSSLQGSPMRNGYLIECNANLNSIAAPP